MAPPGDLLVRVDADSECVPHGLGLPERVGVAEVDHVVAAVYPHPRAALRHCRFLAVAFLFPCCILCNKTATLPPIHLSTQLKLKVIVTQWTLSIHTLSTVRTHFLLGHFSNIYITPVESVHTSIIICRNLFSSAIARPCHPSVSMIYFIHML